MTYPTNVIRVPDKRTKSVLRTSGADLCVGTKVMTALGPICVEDLKPSNLIVTKDLGLQKPHYIAFHDVDLHTDQHLAPVKISGGVLGLETQGFFSPDTKFSARHPMFDMMFGNADVLIRCGDVLGYPGFEQVKNLRSITYVALGFAEHQIVSCDGAQIDLGAPTQAAARMILGPEEARLALQLVTPTRQLAKQHSFPLH